MVCTQALPLTPVQCGVHPSPQLFYDTYFPRFPTVVLLLCFQFCFSFSCARPVLKDSEQWSTVPSPACSIDAEAMERQEMEKQN